MYSRGSRWLMTLSKVIHTGLTCSLRNNAVTFLTSGILPEGASELGGKAIEPCGDNHIHTHRVPSLWKVFRSRGQMTLVFGFGAAYSTYKLRSVRAYPSRYARGSCQTLQRETCQPEDTSPLRVCTWYPRRWPRRKQAGTTRSSSWLPHVGFCTPRGTMWFFWVFLFFV